MVRRCCGPVYLVSCLLLSLVVSCCVLLVDRLNATRKESFLFHMEVLHPMQNPRGDDMKRLPVTVRSLNDDSSLGGQRLMPVTVRERHERGGGKRDICIWAVTWRAPYIPSGILRRHDPPPSRAWRAVCSASGLGCHVCGRHLLTRVELCYESPPFYCTP